NITGGPDLSLFEANSAASLVSDAVDPNANIIFGVMIDPEMKDEVSITVIATGFEGVYGTAVNSPATLFSSTPAYKGGAVTQRPAAPVNRTEPKPSAPAEVDIPWFLRDKK
ncbi:MAG: cell division protein FtsZ, partial [Clostridia bacterium]|nr:cell division protein FtsZ [Clostridia bacterium]